MWYRIGVLYEARRKTAMWAGGVKRFFKEVEVGLSSAGSAGIFLKEKLTGLINKVFIGEGGC